MQPQFDLEQLYVTLFKQQRVADATQAAPRYEPIVKNLAPTGIHVVDECVKWLAEGKSLGPQLYKRLGVSAAQLRTVLVVLTGYGVSELNHFYRLKRAEELTRYCDMPLTDIARHAGFKTLAHFSRVIHETYHMTATQYRRATFRPDLQGTYLL